jgi:hypothetical protein
MHMSDRSTATKFGRSAGRTASRSAPTDRLDFDIMIVGAQKSATSTLLSHLLCAPGVAPIHQDEIAYFVHDDEYEQGGSSAVRKYFGSKAPSDALRIGKAAGMLTSPLAMSRLLVDSPRVRLTAVLRNPVDRAYSAYWYAKRRGFEPARSFSEAIDRELSGQSLQIPRQDLREYILRGEYAAYLERLYAEIDPQRVNVYLLEDLRADPRRIADDILKPFGLAIPPSVSPPARINTSARARSQVLARLTESPSSRLRRVLRPMFSPALRGSIRRAVERYNDLPFRPPPMENDVRAKLAEYYEPHDRRLEALIDRDLSGWDKPPR